jgi:hypothetical protein
VPEFGTDVSAAAEDTRELWFWFGIDDGSQAGGPAASMRALSDRLPRANADQAGAEVPWRAALLAGGASRDEVIGRHALDQSSARSMVIGFSCASRDPLQRALPRLAGPRQDAERRLERPGDRGSGVPGIR